MAENPEPVRDAQTEPKPEARDAQPVAETIVGPITSDPSPKRTPEEQIEFLNRESATHRKQAETVTQEKVALQARYDALQTQIADNKRTAELANMEETERLRAEKLDADRKAEEATRTAEEILKRATVMTLASGMNLINPADAVGVVDMAQIPVNNGVVDANAAQAQLNSAIATRSHWVRPTAAPQITPVPPDAGNPAPSSDPPGPIETYRQDADPLLAVKKANTDYLSGKTNIVQQVRDYNKAYEKSGTKFRSGKMFPDPTRDASLPNK